MKRMLFITLAASVSLLGVDPSFAGGSNRRAIGNYVNATCHQKIDPKGLKGPALKAAWKECKANTDTYN